MGLINTSPTDTWFVPVKEIRGVLTEKVALVLINSAVVFLH